MGSCIKCGRKWHGYSHAHCTVCHEHFSTVSNFDRHRPGGVCHDPGTIPGRNGRPFFKPVRNDLGVTWVQDKDRPSEAMRDNAA